MDGKVSEQEEQTEIKEKEKKSWFSQISTTMWIIIVIIAIAFINYMRSKGSSIQQYLPQIVIGALILYFIGSKKVEDEGIISEDEAITLANGMLDSKIKKQILPSGTRYYGGLTCVDKQHDGQVKHYVAGYTLVLPDMEKKYIGVKVNYKRPGNPRLFITDNELKGTEIQPTVYLPGRLSKEREKYPWMFGGRGG